MLASQGSKSEFRDVSVAVTQSTGAWVKVERYKRRHHTEQGSVPVFSPGCRDVGTLGVRDEEVWPNQSLKDPGIA